MNLLKEDGMRSKLDAMTAAFVACSLCVSSTAASAGTRPSAAIPSAVMTAESTLIMCAAAAATAVMAQAPAPAGCVLPVADAPPVVQADTPLPAQAVVAETPGFAFGLPAIIALAALAAGAFLLFADDEEGEGSFSRG
jgi:hypothetical protein